ncbi:MAG: hypothetical protein ABII89_02270 [Candidatus Omnitrophota bacterium]
MFNFKKKEAVNRGYFCQKCGRKKWLTGLIRGRFCLHCIRNTANDIHVSISENITARDSFNLKKKSPGFREFAVKIIVGWFGSHRYKDGVDLSRSLDKEKDKYDEVVKDHRTGKIVYENHEKLSEHKEHGSAKQR